MKYEEIEVGKTYLLRTNEKNVKYKEDTTKEVVVLNAEVGLLIYNEDEYKHWTEKHELPDVGLVVTNTNYGRLIYRTGEKIGYGFNRGKYEFLDNWSFVSNPTYWRKATKEEEEQFIELLKKEAERKGLHADSKIKECLVHGHKGKDWCAFGSVFTLEEGWNKNGCIFKGGEWATPLKNDLSEQIEELKEKAKELNLKITVTIE